MTKAKKNNLKIIGATAMCLFTLTGLFTGTLAWFASNSAVAATGMSVTVDPGSDLQILSCYAVRYDGNYGAIAYDITGGNESVTMSEYDYIFTDRNVNTPLFLRMEISNFDTDKNLAVNIPCSGSYMTDEKIDPWLSNVVCAKFMRGIKVGDNVVPDTNTWTGTGQTTQAVVNSYKGMLANAADVTGTPFVNNGTKQNAITLTLSASSIFDSNYIFTKTVNGQPVEYVVAYVVLDYYVNKNANINLVTSYLDSYHDTSHSLSFVSDIQKMTLRNEAN